MKLEVINCIVARRSLNVVILVWIKIKTSTVQGIISLACVTRRRLLSCEHHLSFSILLNVSNKTIGAICSRTFV